MAEYMTLREVANWRRVAECTIRRAVKRKEIPAEKVGRRLQFNRADVEAACKRNAERLKKKRGMF